LVPPAHCRAECFAGKHRLHETRDRHEIRASEFAVVEADVALAVQIADNCFAGVALRGQVQADGALSGNPVEVHQSDKEGLGIDAFHLEGLMEARNRPTRIHSERAFALAAVSREARQIRLQHAVFQLRLHHGLLELQMRQDHAPDRESQIGIDRLQSAQRKRVRPDWPPLPWRL
jgi:hypothetical protein